MKSISRLKDEARKYEQREEWEKAIQAYLQVLKIADDEDTEVELPLYNRLGDICVRLGRPDEAVRHYEQAADRYAEAGLYNNAIALCNKALRYNRDRLELIRKLGQFSAQQGFITDARRYFLDYAERQFNAGRVDDALNALEDFAEVAEDADVREMLGRRMLAHGRTAGAVNALQRAYAMRLEAGETDKAEALRAELEAMDADASVESAPSGTARASAAHVDELPRLEPDPSEFDSFEEPGAVETPAPPDAFDAGTFEIEGFETTGAAEVDAGPADRIEGLESETVDFGDVDADAMEDVGLMRDETSFRDDMFPEQGPVSSGESFDLPLLGDDTAEEETPESPRIDYTPIDLGPDFSFDLGSFGAGTMEPSTDVPGAAGADDDGIDLPTIEHAGDDMDVHTSAGADDDGIALGGDDTEAFDLPTFDGEAAVESEPPQTWEMEPGPDLGASTFEPEPSGWDAALEDASAPELPELEEPAAAEPPVDEAELPLIDDSPPERRPGEAVHERAPEIPAIELPTWDTEPGVSEPLPDEVQPRAAEPAAQDWLDDVAEEPAAARDDGWLDDTIADAGAAIEDLVSEPEPEPEAERASAAIEDVAARERRAQDAARERAARAPSPPADEGFIDLGALITEDDEEEGTRFRIQETEPTGDEDRDFAELLSQFKSKVHEHLPPEDASAHYDLGLAFKEMGLVDEAIGEFQIALRAGEMRLRVHEELGQCFLMKEQYNVAEKVLKRALNLKYDDELELLGVYYHLGRTYEALGQRDQARDAYERVLGMDINFGDVSTRLARL